MNRATKRQVSRPAIYAVALAVAFCTAAFPAQASAYPTSLQNGSFDYPGGLSFNRDWRYTWYTVNPDSAQYWWTPTESWVSFSSWDPTTFGWTSDQTADTGSRCAHGVEIQIDTITGNYYGELCAQQAGTSIYQDMQTAPGSLYHWTLDHCSIYSDQLDKMSVIIGSPDGTMAAQMAKRLTTNGKAMSSYATTSTGTPETGDANQVGYMGTVIETPSKDGCYSTDDYFGSPAYVRSHQNDWESYEGYYQVPSGQTVTRFSFKAMNYADSGDGAAGDHGNHLDDVTFTTAYPLTYDANGGTGDVPHTGRADEYGYEWDNYYDAGSIVDLETGWTALSRPGCTFCGWSEIRYDPANPNYGTPEDVQADSVTVASPGATVYALWMQNPAVTFVDGLTGETIEVEEVPYGGDATAPDVPVHEGYEPSGWDKGFTGIVEDTTVTVDYDPLEQGRLSVTKAIRTGEYYAPTGAPRFVFKLTGTDYAGTSRTWYRLLSLDIDALGAGALAEGTDTGGHETVSLTATFEALPRGSYTLSEVKVSRYAPTLLETTGAADGTSASFEVTGSAEQVNTASYENLKTYAGGLSGNAVAVNHGGAA